MLLWSEPAGPRAGAVNMQRNIITASDSNSRLNRKVIVVVQTCSQGQSADENRDMSRLCGGKAVTSPQLHATCYMLHALFVPFFSLILSFILSHEPETNLQVSSNLSSREHNCPVVVCTQLRDYYNISGVNTFSFIKFYLT